MKKTVLHLLGHSFIVVAAIAPVIGCANEAPFGLDRQPAISSTLSAKESRAADLTGCEKLQVSASSKLAYHVYAKGVQIYRWNGTTWTFVAPSAVLSADANGNSTVGIHYAGPTWESNSGGTVVGAVLDRCTQPNAIPWLLLAAVSTDGPGVFHRVTRIQRVNTVGGNAPSIGGSFTGEEARVPYAAEYFFYREK